MKILPQFFTFKKPSAHSPFSPSSLERWKKGACPASIRLSQGIVLPEQKYSKEGTLAHSVCEAVYAKENYFEDFPPELLMELAMWEKEYPGETADMHTHAYAYVDLISEWMHPDKIGKIMWHGLEHSMPIAPEKNVYGTGDCVIIGSKAAVIIDYKYGRGKLVSGDAEQLLAYMVAVWRHLTDIPEDYKFYTVVFQPRISPEPKWACIPASKLKEVFQLVVESVDLANDPASQPNEGDHCFWCPAKRTTDPMKKCPKIKDRAIKAAESDFANFIQVLNGKVEVLDVAYEAKRNEAARKLLLMKDFLIDTLNDLEEEYTHRILAGENFFGLSVETEFGRREFQEKDEKVLEALLRQKVPDVNPIKIIPETKKLKTITEIEKESKIKDCLVGLTVKRGKKVLRPLKEEQIKVLSEMLRLT